MNEKNKTGKTKIILWIVAALVLIASIGANIFLLIDRSDSSKQNETQTQTQLQTEQLFNAAQVQSKVDDAIKEYKDEVSNKLLTHFSSGNSTTKYLRAEFPDKVVYTNRAGNFAFDEIDPSIPSNNIDNSKLSLDTKTNKITYKLDGAIASKWGIDVSRYQGDIDWEKVSKSGIDYALIRMGYRAYGSGKLTEDPEFEDNIKGANKYNIPTGVYFFTQAITTKEAIEEAQYVLAAISKYKVTEPVIIDVEPINGDTYRAENLTKAEQTDIIKAFCDTIKNAGYTPMIYANIQTFMEGFNAAELTKYQWWFAFYDDEIYFPYKIDMWQYSDAGDIDGINGNVDLNVKFVNN